MSYSKGKARLVIVFNAPVVLTFAAICTVAMIVNILTAGRANSLVFSVYRSSFQDPMTYVRFFGHVFGHGSWSHLINNMMLILVVGPMLEDKYGSKVIMWTILVTALITGLVNFFLFPGVALLGASGIVFAFILLSSLTGLSESRIPITFILVAALYLGQQVYEGLFLADNVSQLTHIIGGCVGATVGFKINR